MSSVCLQLAPVLMHIWHTACVMSFILTSLNSLCVCSAESGLPLLSCESNVSFTASMLPICDSRRRETTNIHTTTHWRKSNIWHVSSPVRLSFRTKWTEIKTYLTAFHRNSYLSGSDFNIHKKHHFLEPNDMSNCGCNDCSSHLWSYINKYRCDIMKKIYDVVK